MSNDHGVDDFGDPVKGGDSAPTQAQTIAQQILEQALAGAAQAAEVGVIDQAEDWVKKNAHPEQAGAILDLIEYARDLQGKHGTDPNVDKSEWLYAWQMLQAGMWNLIGMQLPNGQSLPMVTMRSSVAAEMEGIARSHGEAARCPVRLIAFVPGAILQLIK